MKQIEHIFNIVDNKHENDSYINSQPLESGYWKSVKSNDKIPEYESLESDYAKMYYYGLVPIEDKSLISCYDHHKINQLADNLGEDLLLVSGDFWGIQKFIFDGITSTKAAKVLRSRSAIIQLITYCVAERVKRCFMGSDTLLFGAGKFLILARAEEDYQQKIEQVQKELDEYFLENHFGQNGFVVSVGTTTKSKLLDQKESMQEDLTQLGRNNDNKKFNKFHLLSVEDDQVMIDLFKNAVTNDEICGFCSKRIKTYQIDSTKACHICYNQIELGKKLTKKRYISIKKSDNMLDKSCIPIIKLDCYYYAELSDDANMLGGDIFDISSKSFYDYPKWSLNAYVAKNQSGEIKTFEEYIKHGDKNISSGLMTLKADIDKLGDTFRALFKKDFKLFNRLSREVDFFFTEYITSLIEKKENVYTVFAGGDDLFVIGEYKEVVALAKEIREEFVKFSLGKATISMGLVMFKPSIPVPFVSKLTDEAESRAKIERDSINIFGVSMTFEEFYTIEEAFERVTHFLEIHSKDTTAFYYRLIELCDMQENLSRAMSNEETYKGYRFNPEDALWKSKLNYLFRRNIGKEDNDTEIFDLLNSLIEKGEKLKPHIFLKIYQNRDQQKGGK